MECYQAHAHLSNSKIEKLSLTPNKESTKASVCGLYQHMPRKILNIFWKIERAFRCSRKTKEKHHQLSGHESEQTPLSPRICSDSCPLSLWCYLIHPLLSCSFVAFNLSQHQCLFQWVSSSYQVAKYWSFSFSISPSSECSRLISFRIDWFDLCKVQGTLKHLLQHNNSKE